MRELVDYSHVSQNKVHSSTPETNKEEKEKNGFSCRMLALNLRSYTDCINLHVEGG